MSYSAVQGDVIWLDFDPRAGHEQIGRCPAIIASNEVANRLMRPMAVVCPITSADKWYPTRVHFEGQRIRGYIMCDQMRTADLSARYAEFIEKAPDDVLNEVLDIIVGMVERLPA